MVALSRRRSKALTMPTSTAQTRIISTSATAPSAVFLFWLFEACMIAVAVMVVSVEGFSVPFVPSLSSSSLSQTPSFSTINERHHPGIGHSHPPRRYQRFTTAAFLTTPRMGTAQPDVQIKTKTTVDTKSKPKILQKTTVQTGEPVSKRKEEFQDAPMFKLMLLADESYDAEHVVTRMCAILEDLDEDQAITVYKQAMQTGKAMCGTYPFEIAELYKEQLIRSTPMIFADMQED